MSKKVKRVAAALFTNNSQEIGDVKFFSGTRANVTAKELAEQVDLVTAQLKAGTVQTSEVLGAEQEIAVLAS